MDILQFQTDTNLEESGVACPFGDATVTIRSRQSEAYKKVMKELFAPHESSISLNVLPDDTARDLVYQGMARGLVVSWDGIQEGGQLVPFSVDKALEYIRKYSTFRNFIDSNADRIDNFRARKEAAEVKNS